MTFAIRYTDTLLIGEFTRAGLGPGGVGSRVGLWLDDVGVEGMVKFSLVSSGMGQESSVL